jgi:hypothetical protein
MFVKNLVLASVFASVVMFPACSPKEEDPLPAQPDKCASKNITLTATVVNAASCSSNGSLVMHARGSNGFTFKINAQNYQTDSVYAGLAAGNYTITTKDADGCTKTETFIIGENPFKGQLYTAVSSLIATKCNQTCHTSGSGGAPRNIFATDCDIVSRKSMVVVKSVNGSMGSLNNTEKTKITDWIAAGGTINN